MWSSGGGVTICAPGSEEFRLVPDAFTLGVSWSVGSVGNRRPLEVNLSFLRSCVPWTRRHPAPAFLVPRSALLNEHLKSSAV